MGPSSLVHRLAVSPTDASKPLFVGPSLLLIAPGLVAVVYTVAGWSLSRRRTERDDFLTWLASSCLLFAMASVDYIAFPSIFADWIYVGDVLRLGVELESNPDGADGNFTWIGGFRFQHSVRRVPAG
jgi:hypothetical protein